jgi:hypothetical protein
VKNFEVVSVDGNTVVAKTEEGAREYTLPNDFRFSMGGKQVSVPELKPGMKGTATITTTTTSKPVYVTEVRETEVVQASANSIIVRGKNGFQMFTEGDVEKRGIKIFRNGKPVQFSDLNTRDRLTATIVTEGTPQVVTERQVQAKLAEPAPPAAASAPAAAPAAAATATPPPAAAASPAPSTPPPAPVATQTTATETSTATSPLLIGILLGAIALAVVAWALTRRRRQA